MSYAHGGCIKFQMIQDTFGIVYPNNLTQATYNLSIKLYIIYIYLYFMIPYTLQCLHAPMNGNMALNKY